MRVRPTGKADLFFDLHPACYAFIKALLLFNELRQQRDTSRTLDKIYRVLFKGESIIYDNLITSIEAKAKEQKKGGPVAEGNRQ